MEAWEGKGCGGRYQRKKEVFKSSFQGIRRQNAHQGQMHACSGETREEPKLSPVATLQVTPMKEMKVQTGKQTAWQNTEVMPQYRANLKNTRMFLFGGEGSWSEVFQMPKRSLSNHQLTTRVIEQEHLQLHMTKNMDFTKLVQQQNKLHKYTTQKNKSQRPGKVWFLKLLHHNIQNVQFTTKIRHAKRKEYSLVFLGKKKLIKQSLRKPKYCIY